MYTKAWSIDRKGEWGGGTKKIFHEAPPPQQSRIHIVRTEIASLPQRALKSTTSQGDPARVALDSLSVRRR